MGDLSSEEQNMRFRLYIPAAVALGCLATLPQSGSAGVVDRGFTEISHAAIVPPPYLLQISHRSRFRRTIRVTGIITNEGVECTALRSDDGRLYTLAGRFRLKPGTRVRVIGRLAEASFCMQGTTINPRHIFAAR